MSVSLAHGDPLTPPGLPRAAMVLVLMLALVLHLAVGALLFWTAQRDGTVAEGQGGLTVGLGPAGAAPGALSAVAAETVAATTPEAAPRGEAADATEAVLPPEVTTASTATAPTAPAAAIAQAPAVQTPADSMDLAQSVAPVVAPGFEPAVTAPDTLTAFEPPEGLGVSRRPASRPQSVEEAGRQAAAEAARDTEAPAQQRSASSGQQGQSGASQSGTRGGGDGTDGGGTPGARADFAAIVAARLARAKQYPRSAQRARIEGTGTIWFRMNAAGQVTASRLTRGTGHAVLDQAIIDTLRRARLPRIPDSLGLAQMEFSVPMSFSLR